MPSIGHVSSSFQGLHFQFKQFVYLQREWVVVVAALMKHNIYLSESVKGSKFIHHRFAS